MEKEDGQESYQKRLCQAGEDELLYLVLLKMEHGLSKKWESGADYYVQLDYFKHGWLYQMADDVTVKKR